jgi:hypothetical protein
MKLKFFFSILILFSLISRSQESRWSVVTDDNGDTLDVNWSPADTSYVNDELIIKFKPHSIDLEQLCYDYLPNYEVKPTY